MKYWTPRETDFKQEKGMKWRNALEFPDEEEIYKDKVFTVNRRDMFKEVDFEKIKTVVDDMLMYEDIQNFLLNDNYNPFIDEEE